jgi:hypothetical protein
MGKCGCFQLLKVSMTMVQWIHYVTYSTHNGNTLSQVGVTMVAHNNTQLMVLIISN